MNRTLLQGAGALVVGFVLVGCGPEASPQGLVRWGARSCSSIPDAGAPLPGQCMPPSQHASNTAINAPIDAQRFRCVARVNAGDRTVVLGFRAEETRDPAAWPGALELRGLMNVAAAGPATIGRPIEQCEVVYTEGTTAVTARCGTECTVTVTQFVEESGTIVGNLRCGYVSDGAGRFRNLQNADGVPTMGADFSIKGCTIAP